MANTFPSLAALAIVLATPLAACSSLGGLSPPVSGGVLASTDLADAVFAIDMPATVEPGETGPRVTYGAAIDLTLVRADAEAVMAVLPPPAEGRSYAVYAFAEADRGAIRSAASRPGERVVITPGICLTSDADKSRDSVAVLAVLPGQQPVSLLPPETLSAMEARIGAALPPCSGHSG